MSIRALITWPYKAGGRSRCGSPKAGTTLLLAEGMTIAIQSFTVSVTSTCPKWEKKHQVTSEQGSFRWQVDNKAGADTPQFRGGNPYFFSENPYQSVSFIYASMYRENVHAIHITMQFLPKKL